MGIITKRIFFATMTGASSWDAWASVAQELIETKVISELEILVPEPWTLKGLSSRKIHRNKITSGKLVLHVQIRPGQWVSGLNAAKLYGNWLGIRLLEKAHVLDKNSPINTKSLISKVSVSNIMTEFAKNKEALAKYSVCGDFLALKPSSSEYMQNFLEGIRTSNFFSLSHGAVDGEWLDDAFEINYEIEARESKTHIFSGSKTQSETIVKRLETKNYKIYEWGHPRFDSEHRQRGATTNLIGIPFFSRPHSEFKRFSKVSKAIAIYRISKIVPKYTGHKLAVFLHPNERSGLTKISVYLSKITHILSGVPRFAPAIAKGDVYQYRNSPLSLTWFSGLGLDLLPVGVLPVEIRHSSTARLQFALGPRGSQPSEFDLFQNLGITFRTVGFQELVETLKGTSRRATLKKLQNSFNQNFFKSKDAVRRVAEEISKF